MREQKETKNKDLFIAGLSGGITSLLITAIALSAFGLFPQELTTLKQAQATENPSITDQIKLATADITSQETKIITTVEQVNPAVVSIIIKQEVPTYERSTDNFFGFPQLKQNGTEIKKVGGGSGFIISPDGYIVTNKHVVSSDKAEYTVFLNDGTEYPAEVKARDPLNDIAVVKIDADNLPFLSFGDSENLKIGQSVIAIGNPLLEFSNSVSVGVVSGLSRSITAGSGFGQSEQLDNVIQTDAAINPGNSGGPLLNLNGEVIGVNVAVASAENIGFALPVNEVKNVIESVKQNGEIIRPYLGIRFTMINDKIKSANNLKVDYGALVIRGDLTEELAVMPGSPADKAGIEENDIILEIDDTKVDEDHPINRIIANKNVGDIITMKILHDGNEATKKIKLEKLEQQ